MDTKKKKKKLLEYKSQTLSVSRERAQSSVRPPICHAYTRGCTYVRSDRLRAASFAPTHCDLLILGNALSSAFFFRQSRTNFSLTLCSRSVLAISASVSRLLYCLDNSQLETSCVAHTLASVAHTLAMITPLASVAVLVLYT